MDACSPTSRREKRALLMAFLQSDAFGPESPVIVSPPTELQDFAKLAAAVDVIHAEHSAATASSRRHHASAADADSSSNCCASDSSTSNNASTNVSLKEGKRLFESRSQHASRRVEMPSVASQKDVTLSNENNGLTPRPAVGELLTMELTPRPTSSTTDTTVTPQIPSAEEESVIHLEEKSSYLEDDTGTRATSSIEKSDENTQVCGMVAPMPEIPRLNLRRSQELSKPADKVDDGLEKTPGKSESQPLHRPHDEADNAHTTPAHQAHDAAHHVIDGGLLSTATTNSGYMPPSTATTNSGYMPSSSSSSSPTRSSVDVAATRSNGDDSSSNSSSSSSEGFSDFSVPRATTTMITALNGPNPNPNFSASCKNTGKHTGKRGDDDKHVVPTAAGNPRASGGGHATAARQSRTTEKLEQVIADATKDLTFSPHISDLPHMYHDHQLQRQKQLPHHHKYHPAIEEASKELTFSPRIHALPSMYRDHYEQRMQNRRQRAISQPIFLYPSPPSSTTCTVPVGGGGVHTPSRKKGAGGDGGSLSFSSPTRANFSVTGRSQKIGSVHGGKTTGGGNSFHGRAMAWQNRVEMRIRDLADAEQRQRDSECSFRPRILTRSRHVVNSSLASGVAKRKYRSGLVERYAEDRDRKLEESCTFAPKINPKSRQLAERWRRISYQCHHAHTHTRSHAHVAANQCTQVAATAAAPSSCCNQPCTANESSMAGGGGKSSECGHLCSCSCNNESSSAVAGDTSVAAAALLPVDFLNREERELEQSTFAPATNKVSGKMKKASKYLETDVASRLYEKSPFTPKKKKSNERPGSDAIVPMEDKKSAARLGKGGGSNWKDFMARYEESQHRREVNRKLLSQRNANASRPTVNPKSEVMAARRGKSFAERLDVHNEARAKITEEIAAMAAKETPFQPQLCAKTATILGRAEHDEHGNMMIRRRVSQFDDDHLTFAPKVNVQRKSRKTSRALTSYLGRSPHERLSTGARPFSPSPRRRASKIEAVMRAVDGKKSSSDSEGASVQAGSKKLTNSNEKSKPLNKRDAENVSARTSPKREKAPSGHAVTQDKKTEPRNKEIIHVREPALKNAVAEKAIPKEAATLNDIDAIQRKSICTLAPRMRVPTCR